MLWEPCITDDAASLTPDHCRIALFRSCQLFVRWRAML